AGTVLMVWEGFALTRVASESFDQTSAPGQLVDVLIAQGISAADAEAVFDRLFNTTAPSVLVSPTAMTDISREMARIGATRRKSNRPKAGDETGRAAAYANTV